MTDDLKWTKKPVTIEAWRFTGEPGVLLPDWLASAMLANKATQSQDGILIETLEGTHLASPGDWIIRGVKGELYPCKPDIFEMTYQRPEDPPPSTPAPPPTDNGPEAVFEMALAMTGLLQPYWDARPADVECGATLDAFFRAHPDAPADAGVQQLRLVHKVLLNLDDGDGRQALAFELFKQGVTGMRKLAQVQADKIALAMQAQELATARTVRKEDLAHEETDDRNTLSGLGEAMKARADADDRIAHERMKAAAQSAEQSDDQSKD